MDSIRIIVADDHPIFRDGLVRILENVEDFHVVDQVGDASSAVRSARDHLPDIALLDVGMPGGGITAAREIARYCPVVRIVMLTASEDEHTVHEALSAGASGYVLKGVSGKELINIFRDIVNGEPYITPSLAAVLLKHAISYTDVQKPSMDELTPRELDILYALSEGASNKQIAAKLHMAERTVKHHMTNILSKLHLKNRVEAALFAQKNMAGK